MLGVERSTESAVVAAALPSAPLNCAESLQGLQRLLDTENLQRFGAEELCTGMFRSSLAQSSPQKTRFSISGPVWFLFKNRSGPILDFFKALLLVFEGIQALGGIPSFLL